MNRDELLNKFGSLDILTDGDKELLLKTSEYGEVFFKGLMKKWKDSHADSQVKEKARVVFESI